MVKPTFKVGELVFAKVRGYPPWPARIRNYENGKYHVFFYGTYEEARLKQNEIFAFNEENQGKFISKNIHRKFYAQGIQELRETPEIVPGPSDMDEPESDEPSTPKPVSKLQKKKLTATQTQSAPAAAVVRKPLKLSDGTPIKRESGGVPIKREGGGSLKRPGSAITPAGDSKQARRSSHRSAEESTDTEGSTPQPTSSRSGRVIKQRRFSADDGSGDHSASSVDQTKPRADLQIDDPRKIWVKKRNTGDMIEIQLDKEKPERWESHQQKLTWLQSTARNAVKLKEFVELGEYIPTELVDSLAAQTELSPEEKKQLQKVAALAARRSKVNWLLKEQDLVESDLAIKTALSSKEHDTEECIRVLQRFLQLDLDKLMVVKQPYVLDTLRKVRRYSGPRERGQLGEREEDKLKQHIQSIQTLAETMENKLKALFKFKLSANLDFSEHLNQEVERFEKLTKGMEARKIMALTEYPDPK